MAIVRKFQNNFTTGLISPGVMARTDLQKYAASCTRLLNAIVLPQGGVTKRPGMRVLSSDDFYTDGEVFLFPFQYNENEGYVLAFTHLHVDADPEDPDDVDVDERKLYVLRRGVVAAEIEHPYAKEDFASIKFIQSNDVMFLAHPKYALRTLKRTIENNAVVWKLEQAAFGSSNPLQVSSLSATSSPAPGQGQPTVTMTYGVSVVDSAGNEGVIETATEAVESPWPSGTKVNVTWDAPKNVLRIAYGGTENVDVAGDYKKMSGASNKYNGEQVWKRIPPTVSSPDRFIVKRWRKEQQGASTRYGYLAIVSAWSKTDGTKETDDRGSYYCFYGNSSSYGTFLNEIVYSRTNKGDISRIFEAEWVIPGLSPGALQPTGTKIDGSEISYFNVYKDEGQGWGLVGSVESEKFVDNNIQPDTSAGPKNDYDPFNSEDGGAQNPGAVSIMQQRLALARTDERVGTMWFSETGNLLSFGKHKPLIASDSIEATLDSLRANEIRHLLPMRYGLVFTSGAEYMVTAGRNSEAISPTSISVSLQSMWGSSQVPPLIIGTHVLFVQPDGLRIRDMAYEYTADGYVGQEVTILVQGVMDSPIRDWAYHRDPWNCVWIVLENGRLFSLTYMHEQQVYAFAEHRFANDAKCRTVTVVREDGQDVAYFSTEASEIYVMSQPSEEPEAYIDGLLETEVDPDPEADGLPHCSTTSGGLTVCYIQKGTHYKFGSVYPMVVETVDPELTADNGPVVADPRSVAELELIVRDTGFLKAGWDEAHLETVKLPMQKAYPAPPDDPPAIPLHTGKCRLPIAGNYRDCASVTLVSDRPVPCTVLAVNAKISIG